jgi:hypothetical protein
VRFLLQTIAISNYHPITNHPITTWIDVHFC